MFNICRNLTIALAILAGTMVQPASAQVPASSIGIIVMHGKGGSPEKFIGGLVSALRSKGYLVANPDMPWSRQRNYDTDMPGTEKEVEAALASLRARGAMKVFVAGHSQGGLFALYFGDRHPVDGIIAIAPGGNVDSPAFRDKLGETVNQARDLVTAGKGDRKTSLLDYEGSKGTYALVTTPAIYLSWFDPEGGMNETSAVKHMNPDTPVLFIGPNGDYPGLLASREAMFSALPKHPLTRLYEPDSDHQNAPSDSIDEIADWVTEVANAQVNARQGAAATGAP